MVYSVESGFSNVSGEKYSVARAKGMHGEWLAVSPVGVIAVLDDKNILARMRKLVDNLTTGWVVIEKLLDYEVHTASDLVTARKTDGVGIIGPLGRWFAPGGVTFIRLMQDYDFEGDLEVYRLVIADERAEFDVVRSTEEITDPPF